MTMNSILKENIEEKQAIIDSTIAENISLRQTLEKCAAFVRHTHKEADIMISDYGLLDEIEDHFSDNKETKDDR